MTWMDEYEPPPAWRVPVLEARIEVLESVLLLANTEAAIRACATVQDSDGGTIMVSCGDAAVEVATLPPMATEDGVARIREVLTLAIVGGDG